MRRKNNLLLGIFTLIPAIYTAWFLFFSFSGNYNLTFIPPLLVFIILHLLMTILSIVLLAFYLGHLLNKSRIAPRGKLIWGLLLVFFGMLTAPIYFQLYLRNEDGRGINHA